VDLVVLLAKLGIAAVILVVGVSLCGVLVAVVWRAFTAPVPPLPPRRPIGSRKAGSWEPPTP
jgi:hypothetical protein